MIPDSDSLLAPLVVGSHADPRGHTTMGNALLAAADAVPKTYVPARFRKPGLLAAWQSDGHLTHFVYAHLAKSDSDYQARAAFFRMPGPTADRNGVEPIEHWCTGLRVYSTDPFGFFPQDVVRVGVLETIRVRIGREGFEGAPELALLRHTWLEALRAADPGLTVHGGTDLWADSWAGSLDAITTDET